MFGFFNKKNIGLTLGGGATKGFIHLGALQYLEENNYHIEEISGTSIGALLGGLIAMGKKSEEIIQIIKNLDTLDIVDIDRKNITIGGNKILKELEDIVGDTLIENLPIPYVAIATDLNTGKEIIFTSGPLIEAIRYSISIPGVFTLHDNKKPIVDGGIINNLPINHLKHKNKIAVSCGGSGGYELQKKKKRKGLPMWNNPLSEKRDILIRSLLIMMRKIEDLHLKAHPETILIRPYTGDIGSYDLSILDTAIERGYNEAKKILQQ